MRGLGLRTVPGWGAAVSGVLGRGVMVESSKQVKPWREAVKWSAAAALVNVPRPALAGAVELRITFYFPRPKGHTRKQRACPGVSVKPDLDKLLRSTFDALKEIGLYEDDARVVSVMVEKLYLDTHATRGPGARILYRAWSPNTPKLV